MAPKGIKLLPIMFFAFGAQSAVKDPLVSAKYCQSVTTCTLPTAAAGDLIVVARWWSTSGGGTLTESAGNNYTPLRFARGYDTSSAIQIATAKATGPITIQSTLTEPNIVIADFAGVTAALDRSTDVQNLQGGKCPASPFSIVPGTDDLILSVWHNHVQGTGTCTASGSVIGSQCTGADTGSFAYSVGPTGTALTQQFAFAPSYNAGNTNCGIYGLTLAPTVPPVIPPVTPPATGSSYTEGLKAAMVTPCNPLAPVGGTLPGYPLGRFYFATDSMELFICTSQSWLKLWPAPLAGPHCVSGPVDFTALTAAAASQEITIQIGVPGSQRYDRVMVSETAQFAGAFSTLTVSMGRPGNNDTEMIGAVPLMASSGDANYWSVQPAPPQIANPYAIVLNFAATGANLNTATAGKLTWEICGYDAHQQTTAMLASLNACSGSGTTAGTQWDCKGLYQAAVSLADGSTLPLVGTSTILPKTPGTVWTPIK